MAVPFDIPESRWFYPWATCWVIGCGLWVMDCGWWVTGCRCWFKTRLYSCGNTLMNLGSMVDQFPRILGGPVPKDPFGAGEQEQKEIEAKITEVERHAKHNQ